MCTTSELSASSSYGAKNATKLLEPDQTSSDANRAETEFKRDVSGSVDAPARPIGAEPPELVAPPPPVDVLTAIPMRTPVSTLATPASVPSATARTFESGDQA